MKAASCYKMLSCFEFHFSKHFVYLLQISRTAFEDDGDRMLMLCHEAGESWKCETFSFLASAQGAWNAVIPTVSSIGFAVLCGQKSESHLHFGLRW